MKVSHSSSARYWYKNYPQIASVLLEIDGAGFSAKHEMTVSEAVSLVEELQDMIDWISDGEFKWERVTEE